MQAVLSKLKNVIQLNGHKQHYLGKGSNFNLKANHTIVGSFYIALLIGSLFFVFTPISVL